jgi:hypothetical protein
MKSCTVIKNSRIVPGCIDDYKQLARFHYCSDRLGPYSAIFKLQVRTAAEKINAGVIVYTMPSPRLELRNVALCGLLSGLDRHTQLELINKNIRCIGRVIIDPRFRGLSLAPRLITETMPMTNVAIIEAAAIMGCVNRLFEKAKMTPFTAPLPVRCVQLIEAFSIVGIEKDCLIDAPKVHRKLSKLKPTKSEFIEDQIRQFLKCYANRRYMAPGLERTQFILSKLTARPLYYIWFNPEIPFGI